MLTDRQEIEFKRLERHTECSVFDLNNRALEAAKEVLASNHNENDVRRAIDRCEDFRLALAPRHPEKSESELLDPEWYPKETDSIMRLFNYLNKE